MGVSSCWDGESLHRVEHLGGAVLGGQLGGECWCAVVQGGFVYRVSEGCCEVAG